MLKNYGYTETWETLFNNHPILKNNLQTNTHKNYFAGRIITDYGIQYKVVTNNGCYVCKTSGKFKHIKEHIPVLGDFVILTKADSSTCIIHDILERSSKFERKEAGQRNVVQVQAANFDTIFIVTSLNGDFNPRKIERFILTAWDTGATPVIILSKADLCENPYEYVAKAMAIAPGVNIHVISALDDTGLNELNQYLIPHQTIALFGASGVGKSTLINTLMGKNVMAVKDIREDDSMGRHTTTHREILITPTLTLLMDTPGMREIAIWDDGNGLDQTFQDIAELANKCKFNDCSHTKEPGCAVKEALESGALDIKRLNAYVKLKKEAAYIQRKAARKALSAKKH